MPPFVLAPAAERDIESILSWTHERFGQRARRRYESLLIQAVLDVAGDAELTGSHARPEIAPGVRTYHLWHSRRRAASGTNPVRRPRHFLLYRHRPNRPIEIVRVLHDSMDLASHLPQELRPDE